MSNLTWTKPYCDTTHLGTLGAVRWATVTDYGSLAELTKWFQGCGLSPNGATYDTVEQAKAAGEAWVKNGAELRRGMWPAKAA